MYHVAATWSVTHIAKGRERRSAPIQGDGEEIRDVETERNVRAGEGLEDGNSRRGEKTI